MGGLRRRGSRLVEVLEVDSKRVGLVGGKRRRDSRIGEVLLVYSGRVGLVGGKRRRGRKDVAFAPDRAASPPVKQHQCHCSDPGSRGAHGRGQGTGGDGYHESR